MTLKYRYDKIVNEYIAKFEKKQGILLDFWIGDKVGEIAQFGDLFFDFRDIRYDIDTDIKAEKILTWYDISVDPSMDMYGCNYEKWLSLEGK